MILLGCLAAAIFARIVYVQARLALDRRNPVPHMIDVEPSIFRASETFRLGPFPGRWTAIHEAKRQLLRYPYGEVRILSKAP